MSRARIAVIDFHGTLCERDCYHALAAFESCDPVLVSAEQDHLPGGIQGVVVPGGFSYGDYIRPGAMARTAPITRALYEANDQGLPIIGICNGFQILCEIRLLPGVLLKNRDGRFICRELTLRVASRRSPFLKHVPNETLRVPIAHKYGQYYVAPDTLATLREHDQIALCYADDAGHINEAGNPNGSAGHIAGVTNKAGNVLGMMPHPERRALPWSGGLDGRLLFESLLS
jgi:phosphoribosylformylglycinamidine synthase subunit PurQ / glutaminase